MDTYDSLISISQSRGNIQELVFQLILGHCGIPNYQHLKIIRGIDLVMSECNWDSVIGILSSFD
jgi:hypothetical protein